MSEATTAPSDMKLTKFETQIVYLLSGVQFINMLEFMMVMPLGPDFAKDLNIPASHLGYIGGSYTAAAAIAGIIGSTFLDRFDRRKALMGAMTGLIIATCIGGMAQGLASLMFARILAGCFGGPATSMSLAIVADMIPAERRGRAMGIVMGAFAVASVLGVPVGLELALIGGWRLPFFCVAALGVVVAGFCLKKLPPLTGHIEKALAAKANNELAPSMWDMLKRPIVINSYLMTSLTMLGLFLIIPNISAYVQGNLSYPRENMGTLYLVGGIFSFISLRILGRMVDRFTPFSVAIVGSFLLGSNIYFGFVHEPPTSAVLPMFAVFMICSTFRNLPMQTLTTQVPRPSERARFMSLQSAVQHVSTATGAFISSVLLSEGVNGRLEGMPRVAWLSLGFTSTMPFLMFHLQKKVFAQKPKKSMGA